MDVAAFWDRSESALGLDEPQAAETVAKAIQVLIVVLLTVVDRALAGRLGSGEPQWQGASTPRWRRW